jgi:aspartyl protease family protein
MILKEAGVLVIATLSALAAGGGVLELGARHLHPTATAGRVERAPDGHYWATAEVDGRRVRMLLDTGSSAVALRAEDAARLGVDPAGLRYDRPVMTAVGQDRAAAVTLSRVSVAGVEVTGVDALVMRKGLPASLLGMSYLGRLSKIEATPEALVLTR